MEFDSELIERGKTFDVLLPDYASDAFARLVDSVQATAGGQLTEGDEHHLREVAEEAMAALEAAEGAAGNDTSRLLQIAELVSWVREIQALLEADASS
jgi:hypothetical protein